MDDFYKSVIGSFDDEVEALVQYGHDCCARIDDRIHECCKRIKRAHASDLNEAFNLGASWKDVATLPQYDVLGNERHKVICELRKLKFRGEGVYYDGSFPPTINAEDVTKLLSAVCKLDDDWPNSLAKVRDTLIHLLGGDAKHPSLSDLFGIWKEEKDGMDAGRCDGVSAGGGVPAADKRCADCDDNQPSEGVAPITGELRAKVRSIALDDSQLTIAGTEFGRCCDAIDSVHASLEREVARLAAECKTQRNNFDQATNAREHWKKLYEQSLEHVHDLEHNVEMWRDRALKEHHVWAPESHYMMLPKDSDGTPVHVGDVVEWCDSGDTIDVIGVGANDTLFYVDSDGDGEQAEWTTARNKRVRHEPTVEDTLWELLGNIRPDMEDKEAVPIVAAYAKRLRLAGGDE